MNNILLFHFRLLQFPPPLAEELFLFKFMNDIDIVILPIIFNVDLVEYKKKKNISSKPLIRGGASSFTQRVNSPQL